MKSKVIGILIAFFIWGSASTYWYVCKIKGFCTTQNLQSKTATPENTLEEQTVDKPESKTIEKQDLLYYLWHSNKPVIKDTTEWTAAVKSLAQLKAEGKKLRVEAPYYKGESTTGNFENLGLARANEVKKLLAPYLDTTLVVIQGKLLVQKDSIQPEFINGYDGYFKWITDNAFVKEKDQKALIYFPYNSTKEIKNKAIITYLDEIVNKLKEHPEYKVLIIGYTDNTGSPESNQILGLKRAKRIKNVLIRKGIDTNRISVKSEGENNPIASNDTKEGKQQNRRVEISLIK